MQSFTLIIFCATVLPLIFTPGPDIIYITTRGMAQGRKAALISTLGICTGYLVHTLLAVLGLTALVYASETLFSLVRYAGAAYLLYLGIKAIRSKSQIEARLHLPRLTSRSRTQVKEACHLRLLLRCGMCWHPIQGQHQSVGLPCGKALAA
jgi:threonine/homoserine/homoserine lactone efflux protein